VNPALVTANEGSLPAVVVRKVQEAELDEMWSFVGSKKHPRWLWEALDHQTGRVVAYVFGRREDQALLQLKALLEPLGIRRFFTPTAGARIVGTWPPTDMWLASAGHNSWSGNISPCARGSNA
jgi:insertion element IS1 protein InsB